MFLEVLKANQIQDQFNFQAVCSTPPYQQALHPQPLLDNPGRNHPPKDHSCLIYPTPPGTLLLFTHHQSIHLHAYQLQTTPPWKFPTPRSRPCKRQLKRTYPARTSPNPSTQQKKTHPAVIKPSHHPRRTSLAILLISLSPSAYLPQQPHAIPCGSHLLLFPTPSITLQPRPSPSNSAPSHQYKDLHLSSP